MGRNSICPNISLSVPPAGPLMGPETPMGGPEIMGVLEQKCQGHRRQTKPDGKLTHCFLYLYLKTECTIFKLKFAPTLKHYNLVIFFFYFKKIGVFWKPLQIFYQNLQSEFCYLLPFTRRIEFCVKGYFQWRWKTEFLSLNLKLTLL